MIGMVFVFSTSFMPVFTSFTKSSAQNFLFPQHKKNRKKRRKSLTFYPAMAFASYTGKSNCVILCQGNVIISTFLSFFRGGHKSIFIICNQNMQTIFLLYCFSYSFFFFFLSFNYYPGKC